ncbi:MAG: hypothetical protein JO249_09455 [Acidobacteria bacterium]|nr:hypothetical protein [Acidobacteriota bacterium]
MSKPYPGGNRPCSARFSWVCFPASALSLAKGSAISAIDLRGTARAPFGAYQQLAAVRQGPAAAPPVLNFSPGQTRHRERQAGFALGECRSAADLKSATRTLEQAPALCQ